MKSSPHISVVDGQIKIDDRLFNPQNPPTVERVSTRQSVSGRQEELQGLIGMAKLIGLMANREYEYLQNDSKQRLEQWKSDYESYTAWADSNSKVPKINENLKTLKETLQPPDPPPGPVPPSE